MEKKKIVVVGGGVSGICAVTKLIDNGYPGELITIIDKGNDPYNRKPEEVMTGFMGCGLWSDGKLTYHTAIGGQLSKYCGEDKAMELMDQVIKMVTRFHPDPSQIMKSDPEAEPEFIKPYFGLRLFPVYHIGTDYLHEIGKRWYDYLVDNGVKFEWLQQVYNIDFENNIIYSHTLTSDGGHCFNSCFNYYDTLIFAVGKSGIDFGKKLADEYKLPTEPKSVQIGCRFEAPQKYFQQLIDISYDFKLYQKFDNVSLRTFCTNNNAAYVAVEQTYGDISFNGHAKKGEEFRNDMTNFGILMEIKGIENPFEWSREVVNKCQIKVIQSYPLESFDLIEEGITSMGTGNVIQKGIYYSPKQTRRPSKTSEGIDIECYEITNYKELININNILGGYYQYIKNFIEGMDAIFEFGDDYGIYIPEVKYASDEPLVNYDNLSLIDYPNIHFVGDALSARGITVSGSHGILVSEAILREIKN